VRELVEGLRDSGLDVRLDMQGAFDDVSEAVMLSAHRIVQEALTNVLKQAAGAAARVRSCGSRRPSTSSSRTAPEEAEPLPPVPGYGLTGMRKRVALFGGEVDAGPVPDGGFRIHARLPLASG
jgi:signal transduction histidine kinase